MYTYNVYYMYIYKYIYIYMYVWPLYLFIFDSIISYSYLYLFFRCLLGSSTGESRGDARGQKLETGWYFTHTHHTFLCMMTLFMPIVYAYLIVFLTSHFTKF